MPPDIPLSKFDRPDLESRLNSRRRLLPQTNASATPSTVQNGARQPSPLIDTFSQFLGMLGEPHTMNMNHPNLASFLSDTLPPFADFVGFENLTAGPSHLHTDPYSEYLSSHEPARQSGWIKDLFGHDVYVGHGKIEDVDNDAEEVKSGNKDVVTTPKGSRRSLPSNYEPDARPIDDIPFNSTPPPCPKPRKLPSLRATSTASEVQTLKPAPVVVPAMGPLSPIHDNGAGPSTGLDEVTEVSLVKENSNLVEICKRDMDFMNTYFLSLGIDDSLTQHIDICSRIQESLNSLDTTLRHRSSMGLEEWNVRSSSWHQKYSKRMLSLRTTLQRLERVRHLTETHSLRPRQRQAILTKLEQHEDKLKDLASKFTVSFDRIRLRHLHFLISKSHDESKRQKSERMRILSRTSSFDKQWQASKSLRAGLRLTYNQMRQEAHDNPHSLSP